MDMKWKQFFTPVDSIDWPTAEKMLRENDPHKIVLLDVRQPKEYSNGHFPGATLIPVGDLDARIGELDKDIPIIVY